MACEYCKNGKRLFDLVIMSLLADVGSVDSFIDGNWIKTTTEKSGYVLTLINYCPICGQELKLMRGDKKQ